MVFFFDAFVDFDAFFGLAGFASFADFAGLGSLSRLWRRAASTRLPTPRPSRASWVGVEVDPEIFRSPPASPPPVFESEEAPSAPEPEPESDPDPESEEESLVEPESPSPNSVVSRIQLD